MKCAPVYKEMERRGIPQLLFHTGQHYDDEMSKIIFEDLKLKKPDFNLNVGDGTHAETTGKIMIGCERYFKDHKPTAIIVYGDVNSTVASALAAVKLGIPIYHVESGLRSYDRNMPEEINRILTDQISTLHFTHSDGANVNLVREGINPDRIYFVGNTMIDSITELEHKFNLDNTKLDVKSKEYALLTLHRPSNVDDEMKINQIIHTIIRVSEIIPIIFPVHPRTQKRLNMFGLWSKLENTKNITLTKSIGYIEFMSLMKNSKLVITDSGGVQEETTYFGVKCLTLRDNTERDVTVKLGTNKLITYEEIEEEVLKNRNTESKIPMYWDGKAAIRIVDIMEKQNER